MARFSSRKLQDERELYDYAIGALARRMRSVAELKRLLRGRVDSDEIGNTLVELVVRKLKDQGYLNDQKYAAAFSSFRRDNEKFGARRVVAELKAKGVHGDVISGAVQDAYANVNEETLARNYLHRKRLQKPTSRKEAAKILRQLLRAGFGSKAIFTILGNWDFQEDDLHESDADS